MPTVVQTSDACCRPFVNFSSLTLAQGETYGGGALAAAFLLRAVEFRRAFAAGGGSSTCAVGCCTRSGSR